MRTEEENSTRKRGALFVLIWEEKERKKETEKESKKMKQHRDPADQRKKWQVEKDVDQSETERQMRRKMQFVEFRVDSRRVIETYTLVLWQPLGQVVCVLADVRQQDRRDVFSGLSPAGHLLSLGPPPSCWYIIRLTALRGAAWLLMGGSEDTSAWVPCHFQFAGGSDRNLHAGGVVGAIDAGRNLP